MYSYLIPSVMLTFTVAEEMKAPLYMMSAGDLGLSSGEVESSLASILEIATKWSGLPLPSAFYSSFEAFPHLSKPKASIGFMFAQSASAEMTELYELEFYADRRCSLGMLSCSSTKPTSSSSSVAAMT